ncbi:MAG: D-alanine--D-alanine ligase [Parvibaculales bacterium]
MGKWPQNTHVAVLMGGWSPEREVSLVSGAQCAAALRELGYQVSEIDVARDLHDVLSALKPDVCFNALHGVGGEDGEVQGLLEVLQIPYTHSGVRASSLAMDKHLSKQIFAQSGLPVAESLLLEKGLVSGHPMTPPYVVKPVNQGSSVGVEIVTQENLAVPTSLTESDWGFDGMAMVERYIAGRELTCGVMETTAMDVMEIVPSNGFYDYRAKYDEGGSRHDLPADISPALSARIQDISLMAHMALGCRGVSRADFRYDPETEQLILLEINTQPGMTPVSLVPEMAVARGMSFTDLVAWILEDASCQR